MKPRSLDLTRFVYGQMDAALDHARDDTARFHIRTALQAVEALAEEE